VRASVGTATIDDTIADALERADMALYQAKSEKRGG
jgi:PleD family two-component response regulator